MARQRMLLTAVLTCAAALASGELHAQAHGPAAREWKKPAPDLTDPAQRAALMEEMGAWLRRLVGDFRYEGFIQVGFGDERPVKGVQHCTSVGEGPGVLCQIEMSWPDIGTTGMRGPYSFMDPAVALYGIGPTAAEITFMQVDARDLAEGITGKLRDGDVMRFLVPCVNEPPLCRTVIRITARPDGAPIEMKIDKWPNYFGELLPAMTSILSLRRVPETPAE